ncbi:MAG: alpha/beta hydrolase [Balneolaceae bacterium]
MDITRNQFSYQSLDVTWYALGHGKPLIILHGWGSSSEVMMPLARRLTGIRKCVLVDLPGFGKTPEPGTSWTVSDYAGLIESFTIQTFPEKTPDILVHSFGNRILLKLLLDENTRLLFDKMVITGGAGLKPKRSWKFYYKTTLAKVLKAPALLLPPNLREKALGWIRQTALWKSLGSSDYQKLSGVMRETFVKSVNEHFDSRLGEIEHEMLLIWGVNDTATPLSAGKQFEKGIKNSALVTIENAGHYAFLDQPSTFAKITKAYLEA